MTAAFEYPPRPLPGEQQSVWWLVDATHGTQEIAESETPNTACPQVRPRKPANGDGQAASDLASGSPFGIRFTGFGNQQPSVSDGPASDVGTRGPVVGPAGASGRTHIAGSGASPRGPYRLGNNDALRLGADRADSDSVPMVAAPDVPDDRAAPPCRSGVGRPTAGRMAGSITTPEALQ